MLLLMQLLGDGYRVWDKSAEIEFIKAGKGKVSSKIRISNRELERIKQDTQEGDKVLPEFFVEIKDEDNQLVAKIKKTLYIRQKPKERQRRSS